MTVSVVVDGAAALPKALADERGILVVPMNLVIDEETRPDTAVSIEELLERLEAGTVTTSGASPGAFTEVIERALGTADQVLVLTLSSEMSSTFSAASLAGRLEGDNVRVIDTRTAAGGEGLVALAAARTAAEGVDLDGVVAAAQRVIDHVHLVASLDDLDHLVRSGRVPNLARRAVDALHVKPLFEFHDGAAHALAPAHGARAARRRIVERCLGDRPEGDSARLHVAVLDAEATDRAKLLLDDVLASEPEADWFIGSFGPVMIAHVGPGVVGLAWWWESP
jgi:DegV family protein with EDD domain